MASTALRQFARKCWPKEQHESLGAAEAHIRALIKLGKERNVSTLRSYRCRHCKKIHVGHV